MSAVSDADKGQRERAGMNNTRAVLYNYIEGDPGTMQSNSFEGKGIFG